MDRRLSELHVMRIAREDCMKVGGPFERPVRGGQRKTQEEFYKPAWSFPQHSTGSKYIAAILIQESVLLRGRGGLQDLTPVQTSPDFVVVEPKVSQRLMTLSLDIPYI